MLLGLPARADQASVRLFPLRISFFCLTGVPHGFSIRREGVVCRLGTWQPHASTRFTNALTQEFYAGQRQFSYCGSEYFLFHFHLLKEAGECRFSESSKVGVLSR